MKATSGNLRLDQSYKLIGCDYLGGFESASFGTCENCGLVIANVATVEGSLDNRKYNIGLDCASTLTSINPCEIAEAKKKLARKAKFVKFLKTEAKTIVKSNKPDNDTAWAYKKPVTEWQSWWTYRFFWSEVSDIITRLSIPVITG